MMANMMTDLKAEDYDVPDGQEICKDFLRNVCTRGQRCRFYHPPQLVAERPKYDYEFCHDYQNRGCKRENCRYIHAPRDDEDNYKRTGYVSETLAQAILVSGQGSVDNINGVPICKDFLIDKCDRGKRCRYWHITPENSGALQQQLESSGERNGGAGGGRYGGSSIVPVPLRERSHQQAPLLGGAPNASAGSGYYARGDASGGDRKRMRSEYDQTPSSGGSAPPPEYASARQPSPLSYFVLEEENGTLRRKIEALKKQVTDLTAANEVLLEQNARLRAKQQVSGVLAPGVVDDRAASTIASMASSINSMLTSNTAAAPGNNPAADTLAAAAVAVSIAQQTMMARTMATSNAPPLLSYPTTFARAGDFERAGQGNFGQ